MQKAAPLRLYPDAADCCSRAAPAFHPANPTPAIPGNASTEASFKFNDALDRAIAKPVAKAYVKVTPRVRADRASATSSAISTTSPPSSTTSCRARCARRATTPRVSCSTARWGSGGLFDPASAAGLENNDEDFGQTLGKWGVKSGPYLMLPILGPSTVRDTIARAPDSVHGTRELPRRRQHALHSSAPSSCSTCAPACSTSTPSSRRSYDRYAFVRNAWLQRREYQVKDGNVEDQSLELEEEFKDDPADRTGDGARRTRITSAMSHDQAPRRPAADCRHSCCCTRTTTSWSPGATSRPANAWRWTAKRFTMPVAIELGHKLARRALAADTRVLKYGAPIGSMKTAVARGEHVHLHNLRSDYLPSTSRDMDRNGRTLMNAWRRQALR